MEQFQWKGEKDPHEDVLKEFEKKKLKERHTRYYKKNRKKILKRQKIYDELRDRKTYSKNYYKAHSSELKAKNRKYYEQNKTACISASKRYYEAHASEIARKRKFKRLKEKYMDKYERVRALMGNIKNWSWDVYPQMKIEREDAEALREFLAELDPEIAGIFKNKE